MIMMRFLFRPLISPPMSSSSFILATPSDSMKTGGRKEPAPLPPPHWFSERFNSIAENEVYLVEVSADRAD